MFRKVFFALVLIAAGGIAISYYVWPKAPVWAKVKNWGPTKAFAATVQKNLGMSGDTAAEPVSATSVPNSTSGSNWDGTVSLSDDQIKGIDLQTAIIQPQTEPIALEILGTTAYDPDTLTKIRPRFQSLVTKVHKKIGQSVVKDEPLVDLFSHELADAKTEYLSKFSQWQHDKALLARVTTLVKDQALAAQQRNDAENSEYKSKLDYEVSLKKLKVYGLLSQDIAKIRMDQGDDDQGIAMMTLRSSVAGKIVARDVAPGNLYDLTSPPLMIIAPLDHLWVWVNVFESDIEKVELGQTMKIDFPFLRKTVVSKVEYISNEVNADTHAVRVRASILNKGDLKSEMMVRARIEIPPIAGQTVVPRVSMVTSTDEKAYIFIRKSGTTNQFTRKEVFPVLEKDEYVVLRKGIAQDEDVVTTGSLLLAQRFEDVFVTKYGMPLTEHSPIDSSQPENPLNPGPLEQADRSKGFDFVKKPM